MPEVLAGGRDWVDSGNDEMMNCRKEKVAERVERAWMHLCMLHVCTLMGREEPKLPFACELSAQYLMIRHKPGS